jgi:Right handed beta helix region
MTFRSLTFVFCLLVATMTATADTFVVTTAADAGPGSLRQGILDANSHACEVPCWINTASTPSPILLQSPLPPIRANAVTLAPQARFSLTPQRSNLVVQGESAGDADGLRIEGGEDNQVGGLRLTGFSRHGLVVDGGRVHLIANCDFVHNGGNGVLLVNSSIITVQNCLIGNNGGNGIYVSSCTSSSLEGNNIGGTIDGPPMPNGANGIDLVDSQACDIGLSYIGHNTLTGLLVTGNSHENAWGYNYFDANGLLGIDIGADGPTEADMPVIDSATYDRGTIRVIGSVHTAPSSIVGIQVSAVNTPDESGHGEGFQYLRSLDNGVTEVTSDANGDAAFTAYFADTQFFEHNGFQPVRGHLLTAITTVSSKPHTNGQSSEFARNVAIVDDNVEFDVTNTSDSGPGSLRDVIGQINATSRCNASYHCLLGFDITETAGPNGVYTIQPRSPLPPLTRGGVWLDGGTQRDFSPNTNHSGPAIEINGALCDPCNGLEVRAATTAVEGVLIRQVTVNGFSGNGIVYAGASDSQRVTGQIDGCYIGVDSTGLRAVPNGGAGIRLENASMFIGTLYLGSNVPRPNGERNIISGNLQAGLRVVSGGAYATGNFIGTDASSLLPLPNGGGIEIDAGASGRIESNVIAFNRGRGVSVGQASVTGITGNSIHSNGGAGIAVNDVISEPNGIVTGARFDGQKTHISYSYNGQPQQPPYGMVLSIYSGSFADASGYGEGKQPLGGAYLTTPTQSELVVDSNLAGKFISYTITPWDDFYDSAAATTSPFGKTVQVTNDFCSNPNPTLDAPAADFETSGPVTFRWSSVPGTLVYLIWTMKAGDMPRVVSQTTANEATLTLPPDRYEWWVESRFTDCYGTQSEHRFVHLQ